MIRHCVFVLALLGTVLASAHVDGQSKAWPSCYPGVDCKSNLQDLDALHDQVTVLDGASQPIRLQKPTVWEFGSLHITSGTVIVTNGFPLTIYIAKSLQVEGTATIRSFEPADSNRIVGPVPTPQRPPEPRAKCVDLACPGEDGVAGQVGANGAPGQDGKDAGPIRIVVGGEASGTLRIFNRGTDGQDGAPGAPGQPGGDGGDGGQAVFQLFPPKCARAPGPGGAGGNGGRGGNGGAGGRAGNGGDVAVLGEHLTGLKLETETQAGRPGTGALGGIGGSPGRPGKGGPGTSFCRSSPLRAGYPGSDGERGEPGNEGQPGTPGKVRRAPMDGDIKAYFSGSHERV